jgi:prepilin-type N-terminal cleavage/methylation domain-containing protein
MTPIPPAPTTTTGGFTLVEVLVSMTILAVASLSLGTLMFQAARQAHATSGAAYQTAAIAGALGQYDVLPFDQLVAGTTCITVNDPEFSYERCVTVVNVNSKVKTVTVVITPSGNSVLQPVSSTIRRTISGNGNPLNTQ